MEDLSENTFAFLAVLFFIAFWYLIRKIFKSFGDKINNAELHREDLLTVLEEIRDELKELNKKNN
jgi:hypothetical protein